MAFSLETPREKLRDSFCIGNEKENRVEKNNYTSSLKMNCFCSVVKLFFVSLIKFKTKIVEVPVEPREETRYMLYVQNA